MSTLVNILKAHWQCRQPIFSIAFYDLKRLSRGSSLGWLWFFIKPGIRLFCYWFALYIGLRAGRNTDCPYLVWLWAGMIPWFFMQDVLTGGTGSYYKYPYLATKMRFPLSTVPTIVCLSAFLINLPLEVIMIVVYFAHGMPLDVYLLQVPLLLVLLFLFWTVASLMFSVVSAYSRDVFNTIQALNTPFFWLSGVIFSLDGIDIPVLNTFLLINPITFFVRSFRCAFCDKAWFWDNTEAFIAFALVFALTFIVAIVVYKKGGKGVPDVL